MDRKIQKSAVRPRKSALRAKKSAVSGLKSAVRLRKSAVSILTLHFLACAKIFGKLAAEFGNYSRRTRGFFNKTSAPDCRSPTVVYETPMRHSRMPVS